MRKELRINKTAFKLFKRRKSGGTMPSIFGVRSKGGEGKGASKAGMVRSRTHDGLADAVLESSKKEEPGGGDPQSKEKGLKGLFSSMRWHKKDKNGKEERGETSEIPSGLIMPGSLTASLECIKEETPKPLSETPTSAGDTGLEPPGEKRSGEAQVSAEEPEAGAGELQDSSPPPREASAAAGRQPEELGHQQPDPSAGEVGTAKDAAITGCGDIIADHEEDVGGGSGGCEKSTPGPSKLGPSKKQPTMVAYQGGGEEMASPDQVDDTYLQEFWDMLSQTEETQAEGGGGGGGGVKKPEGLKENRGTEGAQNRVAAKRGGLRQIPVHLSHKEEQKGREKEQHEGVPNSDEGYWDSTTPGPEEDGSTSIQKETIPRDSYSGDALYDLYTEPDENPPAGPTDEEVTCVPRSKPVSPITTTCSLKTPSSTMKDSKIPISIKHLSSHPASHGTDASNSHHVAHHHLAKSEMHRTKIPVSKVLVRRVSNRGLAGTTVKAAMYHDSAKK
ncbi:APC membrane recruitment protein 2 [Columba livia]|uniref:APC membrane recruitment protein 2 n=1 Tax=Columba livia TaxID=8932 RepID=A0A2I0MCW2_COLLI|nr:APC membrane recruitment protein 2 [Columba livia]